MEVWPHAAQKKAIDQPIKLFERISPTLEQFFQQQASPQKRGRPTHGDPSQVPSPEETQTMRPRHSISPPTASSPLELDENQGYEDTPDHESPDQSTNHTQPRPISPTPLLQLQPFSNQGALMPPPPLPPIQATENPRPIHQTTTLPRRLSPNPSISEPSQPTHHSREVSSPH